MYRRTAWKDPCIVRQSNIEIVTDTSVLPDSMIQAAGRFFKRFDKESCTFVSNVKELYPDD
jgi:F-box protein 21